MTEYSGSYPPGTGGTAPPPPSTTEAVRDEAANVGQTVREAGGQVAGTATEQAKEVVSEAKRQARDLVGEARQQVRGQASSQQQQAAERIRSLADELREMAEKSGQSGLAAELAQQASDRAYGLASWLERREPGDLIEEVRAYARRHPGTFLFGAAMAGVVAGRLTRGLAGGGQQRRDVGRPMTYGDLSSARVPYDDVTTTTPPPRYGDVTTTVPPVSYGEPSPLATPPPVPPPTTSTTGSPTGSATEPDYRTGEPDYRTAPLDLPGEGPDEVRDDRPEPGYPTYGAGPR
jgi:vacuolar-type H+-ATPase subunit H